MIKRPIRQHYQVPRRFGLRSILVATALFGVTLSIIKWTELSPVPFIFYFSFVLVVGGSQVVFERTPRLSSILAGSLFVAILRIAAVGFNLDLHTINVGLFKGLFSDGLIIYSLLFGALFGALYGYLTGTLLAGLYLVFDALHSATKWRFGHNRMSTGISS